MIDKKTKIIIAALIVIFGVSLRFLPHPYNFAPITAIALFAGFYLGRIYAIMLPLLAMLISDFSLGFYQWPLMLTVYASFLIIGIFGSYFGKNKKFITIIGCTLSASLLFFIITNWGVWQFTNWYPKNLSGLIDTYAMALPFFRNTIFGDLFYVGLFFGAYELAAAAQKKLAVYFSNLSLSRSR